MKKIITVLVVVMGLILAGNSTKAQMTKICTISMAELLPNMPEYKKADTSMNDLSNALQQQYQDMVNEYQEQTALLTSKDSSKYTPAQLELKRKGTQELMGKLQSWQTTAQQMQNHKIEELMAPIKKKALDAINAIAKENGYSWVISKDQVLVSPPADDILPLVKKKLGLK